MITLEKNMYNYIKNNNYVGGIYRFTNIINNKIYVGSTSNFRVRFANHIANSSCKHFNLAIKKYGKENFILEILEPINNINNLPKIEFRQFLYDREQVYLDFYFAQEYISKKNNLFLKITYNKSPIAGNAKHVRWSKDQKENFKNLYKEKGHHFKGKTHSDISRENIKTAAIKCQKERIERGEEHFNKGSIHTIEQKNKVQNTRIINETVVKFFRIDDNLNIIGPFYNIQKYCKENKFDRTSVTRCIKGTIRSHKGFTFCKELEIENRIKVIQSDLNFFKSKTKN